MKGTPRASWSEGRHAWLAKLKAGTTKPKGTSEGSVATYCRALGWSAIRPPVGHVITAEGLAILARWDAGERTVAPKPKPVTGARLLQLEPAELAMRLLDMGEDHARAVYDALHTALRGTPPPAHQRPCPIKVEAPAPVLHDDAPTECTATPPPSCALQAELDAQPIRAPQLGQRQVLRPSLGQRVTPAGFSPCLRCMGRGVTGHGFACPACHGAGTIRRTVEA